MQRSGIACEYQYALFDAEYTCESQDPKTSEVYYMRKHAKINIIIRGASGRAQDMRNSRKKRSTLPHTNFSIPNLDMRIAGVQFKTCEGWAMVVRRGGRLHHVHAYSSRAWVCITCMRIHHMHAYSSHACVCITCMRIHHMHAYSSHACVFITCMRIHHVHAYSSRACVFITCMRIHHIPAYSSHTQKQIHDNITKRRW